MMETRSDAVKNTVISVDNNLIEFAERRAKEIMGKDMASYTNPESNQPLNNAKETVVANSGGKIKK
ncbi:MAG: hypothetical protein HY884_03280 [Deltaproteobacteria bacterium]|nr:hypothetical protein [Deltaproteobacteria bacterium]